LACWIDCSKCESISLSKKPRRGERSRAAVCEINRFVTIEKRILPRNSSFQGILLRIGIFEIGGGVLSFGRSGNQALWLTGFASLQRAHKQRKLGSAGWAKWWHLLQNRVPSLVPFNPTITRN
jgi:hypothetical protein